MMSTNLVRGAALCAVLTACAEQDAEEAERGAPTSTAESQAALGIAGPWPVQFGTAARDVPAAIATVSDNGIFVTGTTDGFLGTAPVSSMTPPNFFVTRLTPGGAVTWWDTQGTSNQDNAYAATSDASNLYLAGNTYGTFTGNVSAGGSDIFVVKFNNFGAHYWTKQLGTSALDVAYGAAATLSNAVFIAGGTWGSFPGNTTAGAMDLFVGKLDADGAQLWIRQLGTSSLDYALAVAADANGNAYAVGSTSGALDGNASAGGYDAFIVKYNGSGVKQWTRQLGSSATEFARGVAVDASGNIYVAGSTEGALDGIPNAGSSDAFLVKYNAAGQKQWTRLFGSTGSDTAGGVRTDASGNVYVVGRAPLGFDSQVSAGGDDAFLVKYNAAGAKQWTRMYGTAANETGDAVTVQGTSIVLAGATFGALPGETNAGERDVFLVRYSSAGALAP